MDWKGVAKRTFKAFQADNLTDWAAALTYYAVMALFPALIVLIALIGLFGQYPQTSDALLNIVGKIGPHSAVDTFRQPIEGVIRSKGGAGALLGFGLLLSLWSASGYLGAFIRASNAIYGVEEGRPFWKLRPLQVVVTIVCVVALAAVAIALTLTGSLARAVGDQIGLGGTAVTVWSIAKWPVLVLVVLGIFGLLYYVAPNVKLPGFRWITPGSVLALLAWVLASVAFGFYVSNFGSYNKTYGSLGAVVIFLIWLWITNLALLLGQELNAELERGRQLASGEQAAEHSLQLPLRDEPKRDEARPAERT